MSDVVIHRFSVAVDDQVHSISMSAADVIVHVDCRVMTEVDAWFQHEEHAEAQIMRHFLVVGTGQPVSAAHRYVGTALIPGSPDFPLPGRLVWHLYELDRGTEVEL